MSDFLGRLAARAVGAAQVLRPRVLPVFASPARDFAPAITEEVREVEVPPAARARARGGESSRSAGRFASVHLGEHMDPRAPDVLVEGAGMLARTEALPLPSESASGEEFDEADEPPIVVRPVFVDRPPPAPRGRPPRPSQATAAAAPEVPLADDPFAPLVPRFGPAPRGGPAQGPPAEESVEVRLSIGRLEVHALPPAAPAPAPRPRPSHRLSLQDYLGRYRGGRRGE